MADLPALSIRQPWAWFILHLGKDVENRTWPTAYRGPVLIHAGKGMTRVEYLDAVDTVSMINPALLPLIPSAAELPRGGIVGQVEIVDCVSRHDSPWFFGPHGFLLRNPLCLPFRACRGALGFFRPR